MRPWEKKKNAAFQRKLSHYRKNMLLACYLLSLQLCIWLTNVCKWFNEALVQEVVKKPALGKDCGVYTVCISSLNKHEYGDTDHKWTLWLHNSDLLLRSNFFV